MKMTQTTQPQTSPYGSWQSPLTADLVVTGGLRFAGLALSGDTLYWSEMRPDEGGRYVIVQQKADGTTQDITPSDYNARTRVHEYGGGAFLVYHDEGQGDMVIFSNFADQRLYRQPVDEAPTPLTPDVPMRYADGVVDLPHNRLICVREDHTAPNQEATNTLVAVSLTGGDSGHILVTGHDFYAAPRLSPDGTQLAWLAWKHPEMPWTSNELWLADVAPDGTLHTPRCIAGQEQRESIYQPTWSPAGTLYFVSDRSGWWNLLCWQDGQAEAVYPMAAEFGAPQWVFGSSTYEFVSEDEIICRYCQKGEWHLARLNPQQGTLQTIAQPYSDLEALRCTETELFFYGASATAAKALVKFSLTTAEVAILRRSSQVTVGPGYLSVPEAIEFPTTGGQSAHAFYYPPSNRDFQAPTEERPPLIVISHGGPTGATNSALNLSLQYWTSRGFGVLDVNYGGSTGYGRSYRERLNGQWGIVDVDDCVNGALYLVDQGKADAERLIIRGGSAGGYTTLAALAMRDVFRAGASFYGVSDLEALAKETHKFESQYLDGLIGSYPQEQALYQARSPIYHIDGLSCPVIFFQGLEDKIVLPNQAEMMVDALRQKGIPVAYLPFAGEQHGFRQAANIKRALHSELYFYSQIFGFDLPETAEAVEPIEIENYG